MFCSTNIKIVVCTTVLPKPDIFIETGLKAKTNGMHIDRGRKAKCKSTDNDLPCPFI